MTYPVWAVAPRAALSDSYFVRTIKELWLYGADPVQYIFPYLAKTEIIFLEARYVGFFEGWDYLGVVALGTFALGALGWLRGRRLERRSVHLLLVLIGLFILLSLSGGPSILLYQLFPSFRGYGRAGLLALALTCVATPAILQGLLARIRSDPRRRLLYLAILGLAFLDGGAQSYQISKHAWRIHPDAAEEPWVAWLARQPETVRLVAFSDFDPHAPWQIVNRWNWGGLYWRIYHRHATLNGGEFELLNRDLKRFGASYERMNERGLRFVASLGYNRLAFQKGYLEANPWIISLPWMRRVETIGDWSIYGTLPATGISPGESEPSD